jgi:hypothetical protein
MKVMILAAHTKETAAALMAEGTAVAVAVATAVEVTEEQATGTVLLRHFVHLLPSPPSKTPVFRLTTTP